VAESEKLTSVLLVGAPLQFDGKLFNCAVIIYRGKVLGLAPRAICRTTASFTRNGSSLPDATRSGREVIFLGARVPFGNNLIFDAENVEGFRLHVEICEDVWTPIPPSTYAALGRGDVAGESFRQQHHYRQGRPIVRDLCASQSGKCIAAYMYSAAGPGESTTDFGVGWPRADL